MTPPVEMTMRLYQGRREPIRPSTCLLCRTNAHVHDDSQARQLFLQTGICGACHAAIDAWYAHGERPRASA